MEADIKKKHNANKDNYSKESIDTVYRFSADIYKEMKDYIKAIVLFGSTARQDNTGGDIDVLIILDDVTITLSPEFMEAYKVITRNLIVKHSRKLHITTLKFTSFWEYIRAADPIAVNILRDGVAIIDTGFFDPLQALLYKGKIRPTPESIANYYMQAPISLRNSKWKVMQATLDLYWACIDSAHAGLMTIGEVPPSPEHVADLLEQKMVEPKFLDKKYVTIMRRFYKLSKMILHQDISEISGQEYDNYYKEAQEFVDAMKKFIDTPTKK